MPQGKVIAVQPLGFVNPTPPDNEELRTALSSDASASQKSNKIENLVYIEYCSTSPERYNPTCVDSVVPYIDRNNKFRRNQRVKFQIQALPVEVPESAFGVDLKDHGFPDDFYKHKHSKHKDRIASKFLLIASLILGVGAIYTALEE